MMTNRLKSTDWLATVFYPLSVILMEAFWVSPWLNWIGGWSIFRGNWGVFHQEALKAVPGLDWISFIPAFHSARPVLTLLSVVIVLAAALILTRYVSRLKLPMPAIQAIIIGSGLVAALLVVGAEYSDGYTFLSGPWFAHTIHVVTNSLKYPGTIIVAVPVIVYLWWRGIGLGQSTSYFKDIYRSFILGMAALVVLIIIWQGGATALNPSPAAGLGLNVIAFFFFGLLSIAICHLYVMRSTMPREDAALTSVWRWMPLMLGVIGVMVLIGFGISSIFSPEIFDALSRGLGVLWDFILKIFGYILTPFIYIVAGIVYVFRWLLNMMRSDAETPPAEGGGSGMPDFQDVVAKETPTWLGQTAKWLAIALIVSLVIFILAKAISRFQARKAREETDEVNESLFSWKGLRDDLKELLGMMGQRFKRKPAEAAAIPFDPEAAGRLDIREIFRHLQWEGKNSGVPRHRYETAAEYTRRLERAVPDTVESIGHVKDSLDNIKDMYQNVRYGDTSLPEPQVDKANSLWQSVKTMIRKLRGE